MTDIRGARLRADLKAQGRTVTWLAKAVGYTRPYVSNVLNGSSPWTDEFQSKAAAALGEPLMTAERYRGRSIKIPAAITAGLTLDEVRTGVGADAYEIAWKRSWVAEHGASALATAAERAWNLALASSSGPDAA